MDNLGCSCRLTDPLRENQRSPDTPGRGGTSRPRDFHLTAPPCTLNSCFNRDEQGCVSEMTVSPTAIGGTGTSSLYEADYDNETLCEAAVLNGG